MFELAASLEGILSSSATLSFDDLVERHKTMVYRTAWRMLGSPQDAEDISQEVFLRLHKYGLLEDQNPATWIYRVTVNLCIDQIRKRRPESEGESIETASATLNPEQLEVLRQQQQRLARFITRLPDVERASIVLRDLEGLNSREVAAILGTSEETVRTSIHRAKEKLRQWMT